MNDKLVKKIPDPMYIGVDKYDLQKEWINKIASKYLDLDTINKNKTGLFGYLNEVMATEVRYDIAHRNFLVDETFLNTASLRKSIYNKAKSYNYNIPLAKPSSLSIIYSILDKDLIKFAKPEIEVDYNGEEVKTGNYIFTLSKDNIFMVADYKFMLEFDIVIRATKLSDGNFSYTARYDFESNNHGLSNLKKNNTPYIKLWIDNSTNIGRVISIFIDIYQVEKSTKIIENYSSDLSDNLIFSVPYKNQLAKFNVRYKHVDTDEYIKGYFNDTFQPTDKRYFFYNFTDEELTITFSALPGSFRPALNSVLEFELYTTKGRFGNFNFDGEINIIYADQRLQGQIASYALKQTNPNGGSDAPSLMEVKQHLIHEFLTRENLVTEYDLNSFFKQIIKDEAVYDSDIFFVKKRDDIIRRDFGVYLLLRDKTKYVIPTNSIDIDINHNLNEILFLRAGSKIVYARQKYVKYYQDTMSDLNLDIYKFDGEYYVLYNENIKKYLKPNEKIYDYGKYIIFDENTMDENIFDIVYKLPFSLLYKKDPFQRIVMIQDTINEDILYDYSYINSFVNSEFILSNLHIKRDSIAFSEGDKIDELELSLTLDTTFPRDLIYDNQTNKELPEKNLIIRAVLLGESGKEIGYFDFKLHDNKRLLYKYVLTTDNVYNKNNQMKLVDCIKNMTTGEIIKEFYVNEKFNMKFYFLVKDNTSNFSIFPNIKSMVDTNGYTVATVMTNHKDITLFKILNTVSNPILKINNNGFIAGNIPVIGSHYLDNYQIYKEFFDIYDIYFKVLVSNFNKLENSTGLDLKFFNTYGTSKHYLTDTVHLSLELKIKLKTSYTSDLDFRIKYFIIRFVENINTSKKKTFAISNLIRELERTFDDIEYIEFEKLNGNKDQKITYIFPEISDLNKDQLINYIPEYINIGINKTSYSGGQGNFDSDIKITYI